MIKKFFAIGFLVLTTCLLSAGAAAWAQGSCQQDCRDIFKECRSDARMEYRECNQDNCKALRVDARVICKAEGRRSDECKEAKQVSRECKSDCRGIFKDASRECRADAKSCRRAC